MDFIPSRLEEYIRDHSEPEDEILWDLYRQTNLKIYHPRQLSGHIQGNFLQMLVHMISPSRILEIGTYTGYSAICMARAMKEGGILHTIEVNDEIEDFTKSFFRKAKLEDKIIMHIGDARTIIETLDESFDLVFIDGEKDQYIDYYNLVFNKVKPGGFIIADNVLWSGKVIEKPDSNDYFTKGIIRFNQHIQEDSRVENMIATIRDGLMIIRKKD